MNVVFVIQLLFFASGAAYSALMITYLFAWKKIRKFFPDPSENSTFISVVIAARNEEKNIGCCISSILAQRYPPELFEIIVVNDFSTDKTFEIAARIKETFPVKNLKVLNLSDSVAGHSGSKKLALHYGISSAKGKLIVTTDADCTAPVLWLKSIADFFENNNSRFISGPVMVESNNFSEHFQSLELMGLIGTGASSMALKYPLMCNGANLAFTKELYLKLRNENQFHSEPLSGDDAFLMLQAWKDNPDSLSFLKSPEAIISTHPAQSLNEFLKQRIRWASKVKVYSAAHIKFAGIIVILMHIAVVISGAAFFSSHSFSVLFPVLIFIKFLFDFLFINEVSLFFKKGNLIFYFIPVFILHLLYVPLIAIISLFVNVDWKGRRKL